MEKHGLLLQTTDLDEERSLFSCWFWLLRAVGITKKRDWLLQDPERNAHRLLATDADDLTMYYVISMLAADPCRLPAQIVRVPPLAFLCQKPASAWASSPPLPPSTGCAVHCAQRIADIYAGGSCVVCYFTEEDLTALCATLRSAVLREQLMTAAPPLRASYRVNHAESGCVVCERISFGSVDEFKYAADTQVRDAGLLLGSCDRAFHCFACLLCPILVILHAYEGVAAVDETAAVPGPVLAQLNDARCITTPALASLLPQTLQAAVLWYFGATTHVYDVFYELVYALADGQRKQIVDAVRFINQVVADEYAYAKKGGLLAAAQTQIALSLRAEVPALYSYEKKRSVSLADAAAMKVLCATGFG